MKDEYTADVAKFQLSEEIKRPIKNIIDSLSTQNADINAQLEAAASVAYLMNSEKLTIDDAIKSVQQRKPDLKFDVPKVNTFLDNAHLS